MPELRALYVGGCSAPYHRLEPTVEPIASVLAEIGISVDVTGVYHPSGDETVVGDYSALTARNLASHDLVVLFTTGNANGGDIDAVLDFVRDGKALIGIHCAADSFTDHPNYIASLGGRFRTHPAPLDIAVEIVDAAHPATQGVTTFTVHDELYLFRDYDPANVHLLAQTRSFIDPESDWPIPISWVRQEGAGRIFYISLGHFPEVMSDPNWRKFFQNGVRWAVDAI